MGAIVFVRCHAIRGRHGSYYTQAIYVVLFAPVILGETANSSRFLAVLIGIAGVLMIIKPGFSQVSFVYLGVLAGTSLNAFAMLLTKYLQRRDSAVTVMLYVSVASIVAFLPGVADPLPAAGLWPWLAIIVSAGPLGMYAGILSLRYADASRLAPYTYGRLVLAMISATLVFGEIPDFVSTIGMICIVAACLTADRGPLATVVRSLQAVRVRRVGDQASWLPWRVGRAQG